MKIEKKELVHSISKLFNALTSGYSDDDAAELFGLDLDEINKLKSRMIDFKVDEIRSKPIEHVYLEYVISQMENIHDLTNLIKIYRDDPKSSNAAVGAIRTRSEIVDKIFNKGQDCGLIEKAPNKTESLFGVLIADLTDKKLNEIMHQKINELNTLRSGNEVIDITELPSMDDNLYDGPKVDFGVDDAQDEEPKTIEIKPKKKKKIKRTKFKKKSD
jgi:hypothetical protein